MALTKQHALFLAAACVLLAGYGRALVPDGNPYVNWDVTTANFTEAEVTASVASWLAANTGLNRWGSAVNATAITLYDQSSTGNDYTMSISFATAGCDNVAVYLATAKLADALLAGTVLPAGYATTAAALVENPASIVYYTVDPMTEVYVNQYSPVYTVRLSASPRVGKNVTLKIFPVAATVSYNVTKVVIPWPLMFARFRAYAGSVPTFSAVAFGSPVEGSDTPSRYAEGINLEVMTVRQLETVTVTPVSPTKRVYANRPSPAYRLTVPQHRDNNFNLVVTVVTSPAGLTVGPVPNVTLSTRGAQYSFTLSGSPGTYTVSYLIAHSYVDPIYHTTVGANNADFFQITTTSQLTILPTMNASVSNIPDAYLVNPVTSSEYGGAMSQVVPFYIEDAPVTGTGPLIVTFSGPGGLEFFPASLQFDAAGPTRKTFQIRSRYIGTHPVSFALSGTSAGDYYLMHTTRNWVVHGRNPICYTLGTSTACFGTPGCAWNELRAECSNRTLPVDISTLPLFYDNEQSQSINFTLPTAVRTSLTVTFVATSRLAFQPPSVTLTAGETVASFTVRGTLLSSDRDVVVQPFHLQMSGVDANMYNEQSAFAYLRPKVVCELTPPPTGFYVLTTSDYFEITCDTSPETEVIFTPTTATSGITIVAEVVDPRGANRLYIQPGTTYARFKAISTRNNPGLMSLSVAISGTNAPRYETISSVQVRLVPSGVVNLPPSFYMTAYETSHELNLDLSVPPPTPLNVTIRAVYNDSSSAAHVVRINPPVVTFNLTQRGFITVSADEIGTFFLVFDIVGNNIADYIRPTDRVQFEVKDPLSGRAFDARLRPGFLGHRRQCRVSIGRQSVRFRGQASVDRADEFCQLYPKNRVLPNETYDCSQHTTEERCRNVIATLGHACAWHDEVCEFQTEIQGKVLSFAYGSGFTVFLSLAGEVWTVGTERYGQLGHANGTLGKVSLPESIAVIAAGSNHVMALSYMGRVYTWGANQNGQLGTNSRSQHEEIPNEVSFPRGENITCISAGTLHNAALSQSGRLFMWGSNYYGQLGTATNFRGYSRGPVQLGRDVFDGDAVIAVTLGEYHTMAATENSGYTWGSNTMGQLGRPGYDDYKPAAPVLWYRDKWADPPTYASYLLGRDSC
jgi:hypothetical protein